MKRAKATKGRVCGIAKKKGGRGGRKQGVQERGWGVEGRCPCATLSRRVHSAAATMDNEEKNWTVRGLS